ncbi:prophage tail fiber N-terminal domain-containing protein [Yersinia frederiksenii]|uniref:prophage tail fiber N-terminal domain-containing protein n=1 Tax=Yersinia frederiksenii TaxID=29484 RepID=UPI0011AA740E|nr:prophage tail fiber N-terminal domain-containing protein [Yersinia frederiksenii]
MSVIVSGIMINPVGEPVANAQITLTAVTNSLTVLNSFSVTVKTDSVGAYRIQLEEGSYSITVAANGRSMVYGAVTLDNTTGPSTLNQLLKQQIMESELTPDVILYFRQIQQQVANDLAAIKVLENSASDSAISAGHSRDEARQYASDLSESLALAKGYRDEASVSASAANLSQTKSAESESKSRLSEEASLRSEENALIYRNAAQSAAATAADDASTLAAELTAQKITLQVKTDADRAEVARVISEQIKGSVDDTALQITQQYNEVLQAASEAESSKNSAATSAENAQSSATDAGGAKDAAANSAETAQQNAETTTADRGAAKGFRDEAEGFANQAQESASGIDIPALQADIDQKLDKSGGRMTGGLILHGDAIDSLEAVTKQQLDAAAGFPIGFSYGWDNRDHIPAGSAPKDGLILSRALFPDMWARLAAGLHPMVTDAEWLADPTKMACFSSGDGSTTFRIPDWNGRHANSLGAPIFRGDGKNSTGIPGRIQGDAIRNIYGEFASEFAGGRSWLGWQVGGSTNGVFKGVSEGVTSNPNFDGTSQKTIPRVMTFDASRSVPTANENRMINLTGVWVIQLANGALNAGQINALELASQITLLASRVSSLESRQKFAFHYMDGTEATWANIGANVRKNYANPFPGRRFNVVAQLYAGPGWGETGWIIGQSSGMAFGVKASVLNTTVAGEFGSIIVQTGDGGLAVPASKSGSSFGEAGNILTGYVRLFCWTID